MSVKAYKGVKAKADKMFSLAIRSVGYCEAEGHNDVKCSQQLQTAHIISRRYNATRCDLRNAFCLCAAHHRFYTDHPREFSRFITTTWAAEYYDLLYQKSRIATKPNWLEIIETLNLVLTGQITLTRARELQHESN